MGFLCLVAGLVVGGVTVWLVFRQRFQKLRQFQTSNTSSYLRMIRNANILTLDSTRGIEATAYRRMGDLVSYVVLICGTEFRHWKVDGDLDLALDRALAAFSSMERGIIKNAPGGSVELLQGDLQGKLDLDSFSPLVSVWSACRVLTDEITWGTHPDSEFDFCLEIRAKDTSTKLTISDDSELEEEYAEIVTEYLRKQGFKAEKDLIDGSTVVVDGSHSPFEIMSTLTKAAKAAIITVKPKITFKEPAVA